jgi:hypothetical protein
VVTTVHANRVHALGLIEEERVQLGSHDEIEAAVAQAERLLDLPRGTWPTGDSWAREVFGTAVVVQRLRGRTGCSVAAALQAVRDALEVRAQQRAARKGAA